MIKDLSEAIYYCTITESMEKSDKEKKEYPITYPVEYRYYPTDYNRYYRDMDREYGNMYYTDYAMNNGSGSQGGNRNYQDGNRQTTGESRNYPIELRDYREGRSPMTRKNYMERKIISSKMEKYKCHIL